MFDDFAKKARQTAEETVNKTVDSTTKANDNSILKNQTGNEFCPLPIM